MMQKKKRPGARMDETRRSKVNTTGDTESSKTRGASLEKKQGSRKQRKG
jgi:hypothetical protein